MEDLNGNAERRRTSVEETALERPNTTQATQEDDHTKAEIDKQLGRLVINDTQSYYVSNVLWASLGGEIEELKDLLQTSQEHESDDDDSFPVSQDLDSVVSLSPNAAIMGFQALAPSMKPWYPHLSQSVILLEIFKTNVLPMVHIFHVPTLERTYWDALASPDELDCSNEALLFSIWYTAVISMEPEQCEHVLTLSRAVALKHYQFAVQQAIARADLLNTQSIVLLQAVIMFLSGLRNEDASRTTWSLTALVSHIARAMGLHRDGAAFGLRPLDVEIRRRVWWHICLLDIRSSEYHGFEPIIHESTFDTRLPLNVNDVDLTPEMINAPPEHEGVSEMTFCLIRCEVLRVAWKTGYVRPSMQFPGQPFTRLELESRESLAKDLEERLEKRYLKYCDTSDPFYRVCVTVARLMVARTWLVVYYPLIQEHHETELPMGTRDRIFIKSTKILELSAALLNSSDRRWTWHSKAQVQWHAVALVLSEICSRPPSADCDRAWDYIQILYDQWKIKEHKGNLWRPIKRLMTKAKYVREAQKTAQKDPKPCWRVSGMTNLVEPTNQASNISLDACDLINSDMMTTDSLDVYFPSIFEPIPLAAFFSPPPMDVKFDTV
ncbi:hypothetical protein N7462_005406 [Penicillium macrosclerotiorum]|uniref:uncharacterized protein n=1 Tax=Penicillium macrosclerotiorum TaxID=303699 RepID=UPI002546CB2B|nr:uncharacterized protein N7462_005406 [Penicillium macrosclerotiorum]KAJ5682241.1 hypothetical protein N7462_005406 [Penicillium macrosclerotiorum]